MSDRTNGLRHRRRSAGIGLILGLSLGALAACDSLLEVDLPAQLQRESLDNPATASTQVASVISLYECAQSAFSWQILGNEDVFEVIAGVASGSHRYFASATAFEGDCDSDSEDNDWWNDMSSARALAYEVHDKMQNDPEWTVAGTVPDAERLSAVAALYAAATMDHFGEFFCEMAVDAGPLMTPTDVLTEADQWVTTALGHIDAVVGNSTDDFELPYGVTAPDTDPPVGARAMALGLRARIQWAMGNPAAALAAAEQVPQGFVAWVTRDAGPTRRNKVYDAGTAVGYSGMLGVNNWWQGPPNPVTGLDWPSPIPFTGYLFLGIMPNGRALDHTTQLPVRWAEEFRAEGDDPTPLGNGAEPDTRVEHFKKGVQGPEPREVPALYTNEADDIPLVNWKEMWLIRAGIENEVNGDQATAIALVNDLRSDAGLPQISGTYMTMLTDGSNDLEEVREMIIEETRRALWLQGRYYSHKIQNTDLVWFPRAVGTSPAQGYTYEGAVRLLMPNDEYNLNKNLTLADRITGCLDLPGSQEPADIE